MEASRCWPRAVCLDLGSQQILKAGLGQARSELPQALLRLPVAAARVAVVSQRALNLGCDEEARIRHQKPTPLWELPVAPGTATQRGTWASLARKPNTSKNRLPTFHLSNLHAPFSSCYTTPRPSTAPTLNVGVSCLLTVSHTPSLTPSLVDEHLGFN